MSEPIVRPADNRAMHARARLIVLAWALAACAPALDWREVRTEGAGLVGWLPCKPERFDRRLEVAGQAVRMRLMSCAAAGATYAIGELELPDPSRAGAVLEALQGAMARNLGEAAPQRAPWSVPGAVALAQMQRVRASGTLGDGTAVRAEAVFFARGTQAYQASVVGAHTEAEAVEAFFGALKLPS
jgi:hypothetical protein